jgi:hypothetical protein
MICSFFMKRESGNASLTQKFYLVYYQVSRIFKSVVENI